MRRRMGEEEEEEEDGREAGVGNWSKDEEEEEGHWSPNPYGGKFAPSRKMACLEFVIDDGVIGLHKVGAACICDQFTSKLRLPVGRGIQDRLCRCRGSRFTLLQFTVHARNHGFDGVVWFDAHCRPALPLTNGKAQLPRGGRMFARACARAVAEHVARGAESHVHRRRRSHGDRSHDDAEHSG